MFTKDIRKCRMCGCTEGDACLSGDNGDPCHWVKPDLCSVCADIIFTNAFSNAGVGFNINSAYIVICAAAAMYREKGYSDLWIYVKEQKFKFFPVKTNPMREFYVAHFRCQKILDGLSDKSWNKLGRDLARRLLEQKD